MKAGAGERAMGALGAVSVDGEEGGGAFPVLILAASSWSTTVPRLREPRAARRCASANSTTGSCSPANFSRPRRRSRRMRLRRRSVWRLYRQPSSTDSRPRSAPLERYAQIVRMSLG